MKVEFGGEAALVVRNIPPGLSHGIYPVVKSSQNSLSNSRFSGFQLRLLRKRESTESLACSKRVWREECKLSLAGLIYLSYYGILSIYIQLLNR
jgi:hypothetical protein